MEVQNINYNALKLFNKTENKIKNSNKPAADSDLTFVVEASSFGKDTECFESGVWACISSDIPTCLSKT